MTSGLAGAVTAQADAQAGAADAVKATAAAGRAGDAAVKAVQAAQVAVGAANQATRAAQQATQVAAQAERAAIAAGIDSAMATSAASAATAHQVAATAAKDATKAAASAQSAAASATKAQQSATQAAASATTAANAANTAKQAAATASAQATIAAAASDRAAAAAKRANDSAIGARAAAARARADDDAVKKDAQAIADDEVSANQSLITAEQIQDTNRRSLRGPEACLGDNPPASCSTSFNPTAVVSSQSFPNGTTLEVLGNGTVLIDGVPLAAGLGNPEAIAQRMDAAGLTPAEARNNPSAVIAFVHNQCLVLGACDRDYYEKTRPSTIIKSLLPSGIGEICVGASAAGRATGGIETCVYYAGGVDFYVTDTVIFGNSTGAGISAGVSYSVAHASGDQDWSDNMCGRSTPEEIGYEDGVGGNISRSVGSNGRELSESIGLTFGEGEQSTLVPADSPLGAGGLIANTISITHYHGLSGNELCKK